MATAIRATPATWWDSVADALRGRDRVAGGAGVVHGPARRALERRPYSFSGGFLSGRRGLEPATYGLEVIDTISLQYAGVVFPQFRGHVTTFLVGSSRPS